MTHKGFMKTIDFITSEKTKQILADLSQQFDDKARFAFHYYMHSMYHRRTSDIDEFAHHIESWDPTTCESFGNYLMLCQQGIMLERLKPILENVLHGKTDPEIIKLLEHPELEMGLPENIRANARQKNPLLMYELGPTVDALRDAVLAYRFTNGPMTPEIKNVLLSGHLNPGTPHTYTALNHTPIEGISASEYLTLYERAFRDRNYCSDLLRHNDYSYYEFQCCLQTLDELANNNADEFYKVLAFSQNTPFINVTAFSHEPNSSDALAFASKVNDILTQLGRKNITDVHAYESLSQYMGKTYSLYCILDIAVKNALPEDAKTTMEIYPSNNEHIGCFLTLNDYDIDEIEQMLSTLNETCPETAFVVAESLREYAAGVDTNLYTYAKEFIQHYMKYHPIGSTLAHLTEDPITAKLHDILSYTWHDIITETYQRGLDENDTLDARDE